MRLVGKRAVVWVANGEPWAQTNYGDRICQKLTHLGYDPLPIPFTQNINPQDIPKATLHVLSGGECSVNDKQTWMPTGLDLTRTLIAQAEAGEHYLLGICLGSQMLAHTIWNAPIIQRETIEIGFTEVNWHPIQNTIITPSFHYEEVAAHSVPERNLIATTKDNPCAIQGFHYGDRTLGVQFHPEFNITDMQRLTSFHQTMIKEHGGNPSQALASLIHEAWDDTLFERILNAMRVPAVLA